MLQHVTNVLIGKKLALGTALESVVAGDIVMVDQDGKPISAIADNTTAIKFGVCKGVINYTDTKGAAKTVANIDYAKEIQLNSKPSFAAAAYAAPTQEKVTIDLSAATITVGNRYVIRIVYQDIETPGFQFTHTYEVYAETTAAADLATALVAKVNTHKNRRVVASADAGVITLTAMEKDDNEGVNSLNTYSVVNMEASLYETIPGALLNNQPEKVAGAVITKEVGTPGKGFWKQVRDAEVKNMGYKGQVFTGAYPSVEQVRMVEEGAEYNCVTIEWDNLYLSNDNQYIKTTPLTAEIYVPAATTAIETALKAFGAIDHNAEAAAA